jgi:hypothetical protein
VLPGTEQSAQSTFKCHSDLQDGSLPASALVWRSSLDGVIGRGPSITATLKPATHVITLTGTNKAGLSGTASTTVTVAAVPPVVAASIARRAAAGGPARMFRPLTCGEFDWV